MVIIVNKEEYSKIVNKHLPKEYRIKNIGISFIVGGFIGFLGEFFINLFKNSFALGDKEAGLWVALLIIFLASLFTAIGFFDNWVNKCKCGLIIPTTGFAHSVCSSALDYKKDGFITGLGANFFKLAGSVILYGIISSFFLVIVRVILGG